MLKLFLNGVTSPRVRAVSARGSHALALNPESNHRGRFPASAGNPFNPSTLRAHIEINAHPPSPPCRCLKPGLHSSPRAPRFSLRCLYGYKRAHRILNDARSMARANSRKSLAIRRTPSTPALRRENIRTTARENRLRLIQVGRPSCLVVDRSFRYPTVEK